jgi:hypothetical protein
LKKSEHANGIEQHVLPRTSHVMSNTGMTSLLLQQQEQFIAKQSRKCRLSYVVTSVGFSKIMESDMNV